MNNVILAFGSNQGNSKQLVLEAIKRMAEIGQLLASSSLYLSKALNHPSQAALQQADYINAVASYESDLNPNEILEKIKKAEGELGRIKNNNIKWGPRLIDIDIIDFNGIELSSEELKLPHPEMLNRDFVLLPLAEIYPKYFFKPAKISISNAISNLNSNFIIKKLL